MAAMASGSWRIKDLLSVTSDYLSQKGISPARLTAECLLAYQLGVDRISLYLQFDKPLTMEEVSGYRSLVKRRLTHEPLQYIIGVQEFWSLAFFVDERVLIPRQESELLVETAVDLLKDLSGSDGGRTILDIGTGSGALTVSLAVEFPESSFLATDISADALEVAEINARRHGVLERIAFRVGNVWEPVAEKKEAFDIVISNPPYVSEEEYKDLAPEVLHEPRVALEGHRGGLAYIKEIISEGWRYLKPGGWLLLETAPWQTAEALDIASGTDQYDETYRRRDYSGQFRVVAVRSRTLS